MSKSKLDYIVSDTHMYITYYTQDGDRMHLSWYKGQKLKIERSYTRISANTCVRNNILNELGW